MRMKFYFKYLLWIFFFLLMLPFIGYAEKVKPLNPDCEVCPVVISYEGDEAKNILGPDVMNQIKRLEKIEQKTIKIDLNGIKKVGSDKDADEEYELIVNVNRNSIAINSIRDSSTIKIKTDYSNLAMNAWTIDKWNPEIQLSPSISLHKTDDLELAWDNMKASRIYGYVNNSIDHREWNNKIREFIINILTLVSGSN
ncbi:MAG: hypothetical protein KJ737_13145 [Proteobacteria bacterium]|nr:hypothetical protein [Pseudomonadota bacterium]